MPFTIIYRLLMEKFSHKEAIYTIMVYSSSFGRLYRPFGSHSASG